MSSTGKTKSKLSGFWTENRKKRLIKYRVQGMGYVEIGEKFDVTSEVARHTYRAIKREQRKEAHPLAHFTRDAIGEIIKKRRVRDGVFVVSSVQPVTDEPSPDTEWIVGSNLHKPFFDNIRKNFCKAKDAEIVILPGRAHVKALSDQPSHYDPHLEGYQDLFATEYVFNKHLKAVDYQINPQQQQPLTGLSSAGQLASKKTSLIIASPKDMSEDIATGNDSSPRSLMSSMSLCVPQYRNNRAGRIARDRHEVGALVVTIIGGKFIVNQIHCRSSDGSFNYMGTRYSLDGNVTERAEWMLLGDPHAGEYDEESALALTATHEQFATLNPKRVLIGDVINGASFSPHLMKNPLERAMLPERFSTIEKEFEFCRNYLESLWSYMPEDSELIIVDSNHHIFLKRYLAAGTYNKDGNYGLGHTMVQEILAGIDPIASRLDPDGLYTWLKPNDDLIVEGNQLAGHGHRGPNGSRGSLANLERIYVSSMLAHSHVKGIRYDSYQVGHLSAKRHGYNEGPSAWSIANGAGFKNGEKTLLPIVKGDWM